MCIPDCTVEASRPEPKPLANIMQKQIALDFAFKRNLSYIPSAPHPPSKPQKELTQHARRNIHSHPVVPFLIQYLSAQARAAADIEQERRLALW